MNLDEQDILQNLDLYDLELQNLFRVRPVADKIGKAALNIGKGYVRSKIPFMNLEELDLQNLELNEVELQNLGLK